MSFSSLLLAVALDEGLFLFVILLYDFFFFHLQEMPGQMVAPAFLYIGLNPTRFIAQKREIFDA